MEKSGFFNALYSNGAYDRTYNANDYSENLATIISNGVLKSVADDLKVTASGLVCTVAPGRAWINGHWYKNGADYVFPAATAPVSGQRIDRIMLRYDDSLNARSISLRYATGTASSTPQAPDPVRTDTIYELVLADISIATNATSVTVSDKRSDGTLCGWVFSVYGSVMVKKYEYRTVLTSAVGSITFDIPQYDSTGADIIEVYVNGIRQVEGVDYILSGSNVAFRLNGSATTKTAGTEISVICLKTIDASGIKTISDEVTELQTTVATLSADSEYIYTCNGETDNVQLSELANAWFTGGNNYSSMTIRVVGTFGATAPYAGSGTSSSPYRWMSLGNYIARNRKINFDFSNCTQISIACGDGTYNVIFYGMQFGLKGANIIATGGARINMFSTEASIRPNVENCRFWITSAAGCIAKSGTFRDCRVSLTTTGSAAYAFTPQNGGLLRLHGGEYYAYCQSNYESAVVYVASGQASCATITYGINCPTIARSGFVQSYAIRDLANSAKSSYTDTVTALTISGAGQNIRSTIALSLPDMM